MQKVDVFRGGGKTFEVPESEREEFEAAAAEDGLAYEPVRTVLGGGKTFEVPESEREEFFAAYRADPQFAAERAEDRARLTRGLPDPGSAVGAVLRGAAEGLADAPQWWRETMAVLPANFREGVNQDTATGADGDAALGILSQEEADASQKAFRDKAQTQGEDDTGRRWLAEAVKMTGQQVQPLARAAGAAGAVGLAAGATGVGAPAAVPAGLGAGAVMLKYALYRQAAGEIYRESRDQGLSHDRSRLVALAGAVPFAALGNFQLKLVAKGFAARSMKGPLVRRLAAELGGFGLRTVQEAAAEGGQESLKKASVSAMRWIDGDLATSGLPAQLRADLWDGVDEFEGTLGPMAVMQLPGAVGGTSLQVVRARDAAREGGFLRDALAGSTGAAAEAEGERQSAAGNGQRETGDGGRRTGDGGTEEGADGQAGAAGTGASDGQGSAVVAAGEAGSQDRTRPSEAFNDPTKGYRVVGEDAVRDLAESGVVRPSPTGRNRTETIPGKINLSGRTTPYASFSPGKARTVYVDGAAHYIIETDMDNLALSELGRHGGGAKNSTHFPRGTDGSKYGTLDAGKVTVWRHTGNGQYERVDLAGMRATRQTAALPPARADGARTEGVEVRQIGGRPVRGVRLLMPDGRALWTADPGEVALAEYWLKDRVLFPPTPKGFAESQAGEPRVNASRRAGFDVKPGKSVLVVLGRSRKAYTAKVVEVLDDTHVRLRVDRTQRSKKNGRDGYVDLDVRQVQEYKGVAAKRETEAELKKLDPAERRRVREDAAAFDELLLNSDEIAEQRVLDTARMMGGSEGRALAQQERARAYERARGILGVEGDLRSPVERARALARLREFLKAAERETAERESALNAAPERGAQDREPGEQRRDTPEAVWLARFMEEARAEADALESEPFDLESMTPEEADADARRVATAQERIAQRRAMQERAERGLTGGVGDMTGTLPGMEGTSDVPLFTEQGGAQGGNLMNVEAEENRGAGGDGVTRVGGVRVVPHTTYNQDDSAGMEGDGRTVAPVADGLPGVGMDLRDAVGSYRELRGMMPRVKGKLNGRALGWYKTAGREIELLATIHGLIDATDAAKLRDNLAKRGLSAEEIERQMPAEVNALVEIRRNQRIKRPVKVLTHELGHLIDALPAGSLRGRGNILGHIADLYGYLKQTMPREPGAPGEVGAAEQARLWADAERMAEKDLGKARVWIEEIKREEKVFERLPVTAEDIKGILGLDGRERTPELYAWFARQDDRTKKDVLRRALRGLVDERAEGGAVREVTRVVVAGTRIRTEQAYSRADVAKRFKELLRKAVEELRLIERGQIVAEAKAAIPKWRGAGAWEKYFERPSEMYAELFGIFLSDPGWMEREVPTAFRAYTAYLKARPEADAMYRRWLHDKQNGTEERRHVDRLKETWEDKAEDERAVLQREQNRSTARQGWAGLRYALDRRMGPVYMTVRNLERLAMADIGQREAAGNITADEARAERADVKRRGVSAFAMVKDVLKSQNTTKLMMIEVNGRVSEPLKAAGLDWTQLAEYAFHNRVRFELDGRAASFGWAPETSGRRLDEMQRNMTPEQWETLGAAWKEFRGIYERSVVEMDGMREMLGEETHDLIRANVHYVAFAHVLSPEEVRMTLEERAAAGRDAKAKGLREEDGWTAFDLVASEIERRSGAAGAKIYQLKGSYDPVADPLSATLEKAERLIDAVYKNKLKIALRDMARDTPGAGYRKSETGVRAGGEKYIREVDDGRFKTLHYMEGGELKAFVADHWTAQAFDGKHADRIHAVGAMMKVNNLMSAMYTRLRPGFFEPAYAKDKQALAANIKGMWRSPLASVPGWGDTPLGMFTRYIPESVRDRMPRWVMNEHMVEWREAAARRAAILIEKGNFEAHLRRADEVEDGGNRRLAERMRGDVAAARRALGSNVLMAMQDVALPGQGVSQLDRMMAKSGVPRAKESDAAANFMVRSGKAILDTVARLGEIRENTTKINALMFLDDMTDMSEDEKKLAVSEWGGSPDFSERGVWAGYFEFTQGAFINARKEGIVRSAKAFADHPGDFVAKKMAYTVGPAATRWMLGSGFALAAARAMIPDDKEEGSMILRFLEWYYKKMAFVSDYYQKGYLTIPLRVDAGDDCAVIMTLPLDETERAFNDLTWSALDSMASAFGMDVSKDPDPWLNASGRLIRDFIPSSDNGGPLVGALMPWVNTYALGRPTFDAFRQRNILSDDALASRWSNPDAAQALLGNTWNAFGGGTIKTYQGDWATDRKMMPIETFLRLPVVQPVLGRYIRVVRGGHAQLSAAISAGDDAARINDRLDARRMLAESLRQGVPMLPEYRERISANPYVHDYYFNSLRDVYGKGDADPFLKAMRKTDSPDTAQRLLKKRESLQP